MNISHTFSLSTFCSFSGLAIVVAEAAETVCTVHMYVQALMLVDGHALGMYRSLSAEVLWHLQDLHEMNGNFSVLMPYQDFMKCSAHLNLCISWWAKMCKPCCHQCCEAHSKRTCVAVDVLHTLFWSSDLPAGKIHSVFCFHSGHLHTFGC